MKVYAIVSYDLLEYMPSMFVCEVYATRELAEKNLPEDAEDYRYEIKKWEVLNE